MSWRNQNPSYRESCLPRGELRGRFLISEGAVLEASRLLPTYRGPDGDHEGIVFWYGHCDNDLAVITTAVAPSADHSRGRVHVPAGSMAKIGPILRAHGVALCAQLHTHPGGGTVHSDTDDQMVHMPFEDMLSVVVPHYGRFGLLPLDGLGVHQFQDGVWKLMSPASVAGSMTIASSGIDLR